MELSPKLSTFFTKKWIINRSERWNFQTNILDNMTKINTFVKKYEQTLTKTKSDKELNCSNNLQKKKTILKVDRKHF